MTYLGFTGSRCGMTEAQKSTVAALLLELAPRQARHGDAVGSDAQFHAMVRTTPAVVIVHPANEPRYRANCAADKELPEKPPLARNKDIVDNCTVLIATPDSAVEKLRSGTWSTIRYARKQGRRVLIVTPDGSVQG